MSKKGYFHKNKGEVIEDLRLLSGLHNSALLRKTVLINLD